MTSLCSRRRCVYTLLQTLQRFSVRVLRLVVRAQPSLHSWQLLRERFWHYNYVIVSFIVTLDASPIATSVTGGRRGQNDLVEGRRNTTRPRVHGARGARLGALCMSHHSSGGATVRQRRRPRAFCRRASLRGLQPCTLAATHHKGTHKGTPLPARVRSATRSVVRAHLAPRSTSSANRRSTASWFPPSLQDLR